MMVDPMKRSGPLNEKQPAGLESSAANVDGKVLDPMESLGIIFGRSVDQDLIAEVLASISGEKVDSYLEDQEMFVRGLREAISIRLKRSAVGGKGWQKLGMVGVAVQAIHKAQRLIHQVQSADEHLSIPVDDPKAMVELKNNAVDLANYAIMLVGMIEQSGCSEE
jgi:hypothetical protein